MKDTTTTRVFGLMCVLVGVWTGVYWLYEPADPPVTFDQTPAGDPGIVPTRDPMAELDPPLRPAEVRPQPQPPTPAKAQDRPDPAPAPQTRVVPPEYWEYTVQHGDGSMEAIARRLLGDGRLWTKIAEANPLLDARKLIPGRTTLKIPKDLTNIQGKVVTTAPPAGDPDQPTPSPQPEAPREAPAKTYVVKPNDTLSGIAQAFYGKSGMWRRIFEANRDVINDPDSVRPGTTLRIPPAE
jgi:nucleoid-associated protein YgaU